MKSGIGRWGSRKMRFAPSRGRELKSGVYSAPDGYSWFAPSRGRELKFWGGKLQIKGIEVRPLAGAGIEIHPERETPGSIRGSPPRGGGN